MSLFEFSSGDEGLAFRYTVEWQNDNKGNRTEHVGFEEAPPLV